MSKKKKIVGGICVVLAVTVVGISVFNGKNNAAQTMVSTEVLQHMNLKNTVSLTGTVESETGRKVYSTLTYPIESVNVQVGDAVKEGDVLAKLKTSDLELDIAQQRAAVNASKNSAAHQIEVSRKAYENAKENYENNLNSNALSAEQGVTQAENAVKQAKQQLDSAKAAVRDAKENYHLTRDQLENNVTRAEEALRDAQGALGDAQSAYNNAVAGQAGAKSEADKMLKQEEEKYNQAKAEWDLFQEIHRQDYEDAKQNLIEKQNAYNEAAQDYENSKTTDLPNGNPSLEQKMKEARQKQDEAEQKFNAEKTKRAPAKAEYDLAEKSYGQAQKTYQEQLAAISSGASSAYGGIASAEGGVNAAQAQLDAARDARNGATLSQVEQGISAANRGVDSAKLQQDIAKQSTEDAKQQEKAAKVAIEEQIDSLQDSLIGSQIAAQSNQAQEIAIQKMQNTLDEATITAPVSGVVTAVYAKVGEPGNGLLFVVEDTESLKIKTHIKEYDIANMKEGMPVTIKSDGTGDKEISGTITYISPAAVKSDTGTNASGSTNSSVEFEAEVQVNEKNSGLRIGMNTRLTVLLKEKTNVFGVPYDSVVEKPDGTQVLYALKKQNEEKDDSYIVTEIPVTTGLETDFYVEVSGEGIADGMAIVSNPQGVTPGAEVKPDFSTNKNVSVVGLSESGEK